MTDLYSQLVSLPVAGTVAKRIGLPQPVELERGSSAVGRPRAAGRRRAAGRVGGAGAGVDERRCRDRAGRPGARARRARPAWMPRSSTRRRRPTSASSALVFDASGIVSSEDLVELQRFFYPTVGRVCGRPGRVIVLGGGRRALWRASRARLGKEIGPRGTTVNLDRTSRRAPRTSSARRCASSSRRARPTSPGRSCTCGPGSEAPLRGPDRAGHRRVARDRRVDRRGARARRRVGRPARPRRTPTSSSTSRPRTRRTQLA